MSKRDRRSSPVKAPKQREEPKRLPWKWAAIAAAVLALVGASFVVPGLVESKPAAQSTSGHEMAAGNGDGSDVGAWISFSENNVVSGSEISSESLRGKKTLHFFSRE